MVLKVAVAGTGYFSQFHFDGWSRLPGVELVGVCSLDPAGLVDAAARFLIPRQFAEVGTMLDATAPDLLDIVTPPSAHLAIVEEAARREIDVICQKPLGGDLQAARAMVRIAENAGITFVVHENFRFQPWYREARRLLDAGALGDVYNLSFRLRPGDGQGPRAYLDRQPYFQQMARFLIHETAIHMIDTFRFLLGEMSGVFARLRRLNPHIKGEDAGFVLFDFARGAAGMFDGNRLVDFVAANPRLTMGEMLLEGAGGTLRLDGFGRLWLKPHNGTEREHAYQWQDRGYGGDCVHTLQRHVVAHLQGGARSRTPAPPTCAIWRSKTRSTGRRPPANGRPCEGKRAGQGGTGAPLTDADSLRHGGLAAGLRQFLILALMLLDYPGSYSGEWGWR